MSRTVTFVCPYCGMLHALETIFEHRTECRGRAIYFDGRWNPSTRPTAESIADATPLTWADVWGDVGFGLVCVACVILLLYLLCAGQCR